MVQKDIHIVDIAKEIEQATVAIAGSEKNIIDEVIHLKVVQPGAPALTLTDLPGIVHSPSGAA